MIHLNRFFTLALVSQFKSVLSLNSSGKAEKSSAKSKPKSSIKLNVESRPFVKPKEETTDKSKSKMSVKSRLFHAKTSPK